MRPPLNAQLTLRTGALGLPALAVLLLIGSSAAGVFVVAAIFAGALLLVLYAPLFVHTMFGEGSRAHGRCVAGLTLFAAWVPSLFAKVFADSFGSAVLASAAVFAVTVAALEWMRRRARCEPAQPDGGQPLTERR